MKRKTSKDERAARYRQLLSPELAEVATSQDEAVEDAHLPDMMPKMDMDLDAWSAENKAALDDFDDDDDDEDAKWMAKQRG